MIKYLKVADREYPLSFGIRTYQELAKNWGKRLGEVYEVVDDKLHETAPEAFAVQLEMIIAISTVALNEGARRTGAPERYTVDDVTDLFDDNNVSDLVGEMMSLVWESMGSDIASFMCGQKSPQKNQKPPKKSLPTPTGTQSPSEK